MQGLSDCLSTRFVYDGANAVLEMSAEGGSAYGGNRSNEVVWAWIHGPGLDQPVERIAFINGEARTRQVVHADGLGSVTALTDESGATVQTYAYAAFGGVREQTGTDLNRVTFTAREALGDSLGFTYYRNRVYDPATGRFTSEDPLGFVDGANRYWYVRNNPLNIDDALGLQCDEIWTPLDQIALKNELLGADLEAAHEIMDAANDLAVDLLCAVPEAVFNPLSAVPGIAEGQEASDFIDDPQGWALDKIKKYTKRQG